MNDYENENENFAENEPAVSENIPTEPTSNETEQSSAEPYDNGNNGNYAKPENPYGNSATAFNEVNYSPVMPTSNYKPASKGLRVFSVIIACVIIATASCVAGFFLGKTSVKEGQGTGETVKLQLEKKPDDKNALTEAGIYDKVNKSVVGIRVYNSAGQASDASGVIYSEDGYVITNDHIYAKVGQPKFKIYTYDGKQYDAKYVAGDVISDLAVLKIENGGKFETAVFGNSAEIVCGEKVVAVGRPGNATDPSSITSGIVSLTKRRVKSTSSYSASMIETDSAVNPGSSGGALVNAYGQIIGITSSKLSESSTIGYAIPTVTVKRVAEQLIKNGKVTDRAKIGITYTEVDSVIATINNLDRAGLYVKSVSSDSDAAGKVSEGDIITHINGIEITNDDTVLDIIEEAHAGDKVNITVVTSSGSESSFDIVLKANIGESSYSNVIENDSSSSDESHADSGSNSGGTFDFPFGE